MSEEKFVVFKTIGMELKILRDCLSSIDATSEGIVIDLKNNTHILHTNVDMPNETKASIITAVNKFVNAKVLCIDLHNLKKPTSIEI